jgi:elongation factor Ts
MSIKITASQVNELRKKTGAGMMDCKNALVESEGDFEKAIDFLRKKGQKVAAKREDREAGEGVALGKANADNTKAAFIILNCETDFVAKNDDFVGFAKTILDLAMEKAPANVEELKALTLPEGLTIAEKITEQTGVIGEKIELKNFETLTGAFVTAYNHPGNRLVAGVTLSANTDGVAEAGKEVAMQVAAMNPVALSKDNVSQEVIDREVQVGKDQAIQEGKPAEMADKIAVGRLNKFFKENTLLAQEYFSDNKKTVQQFLDSVAKDLTVTEYKRLSL